MKMTLTAEADRSRDAQVPAKPAMLVNTEKPELTKRHERNIDNLEGIYHPP
jgi:hypothetical protein